MARKRARLNIVPWLWTALFLNLGLGIVLSPVTEIRRVRVIGAHEAQQPVIRKRLQALANVPSARVSLDRIVSFIQRDTSIERATLRRNLFGSGVVTILNKRSVAVVDGDRNVVLCSDGSLVVRADSDPEAIQFSATSLAFRPSFTAMGTWPGKAAADLSAEICDNAAFGVTGLVQDEGGKVSLTTEGKATIILGTLDNFRDKVSALKRAVEVEPEILSRVKVLNVSAPSNPVFVP